ncbi:hypothetical protein FKB34_01965 [Glycocaulis profundi]|nr:hypothetical protein FKB34_01965 [Glycocaulis profundi]
MRGRDNDAKEMIELSEAALARALLRIYRCEEAVMEAWWNHVPSSHSFCEEQDADRIRCHLRGLVIAAISNP